MGQRKLKLGVGVLGFLLSAASVFASNTQITARVQAVLTDGTIRCDVIKFLNIDPDELKDVKRGKALPKHVDVNFNEVALPKSAPFRAQAIKLMRRLCVGRKVTILVGLPMWRKGKVIADVEVSGTLEPTLQLVLVKQGLASYKSDGGPTDNILYDAEQSARDRGIGMWAKLRH